MSKFQRELREMGVGGDRWVQEEYGWADIGKKMLTAYGWLLAGRTQPECVQTCAAMQRAA